MGSESVRQPGYFVCGSYIYILWIHHKHHNWMLLAASDVGWEAHLLINFRWIWLLSAKRRSVLKLRPKSQSVRPIRKYALVGTHPSYCNWHKQENNWNIINYSNVETSIQAQQNSPSFRRLWIILTEKNDLARLKWTSKPVCASMHENA